MKATVDRQKKRVLGHKTSMPIDVIKRAFIKNSDTNRPSFALAKRLREDIKNRDLAVIGTSKIAADWDKSGIVGCAPEKISRKYAQAGVSAISAHFSLDIWFKESSIIQKLAESSLLPVLHTGIIIDEWQIAYARLHGASAVQLITAYLDSDQLPKLVQAARHYGLDALIDAHDESELNLALSCPDAIIGININGFRVDLNTSMSLCALALAQNRLVVGRCESTRESIAQLHKAGLKAFVVDENQILQPNPSQSLAELFGTKPAK